MLFNASTPLIDRFGKTFIEKHRDGEEITITLGIVVVRTIDLILPEDKDIKAEDMRKRDILACKCMSQKEVELTAKEVAFLQYRVCNFGANIAGQLIKALEKGE